MVRNVTEEAAVCTHLVLNIVKTENQSAGGLLHPTRHEYCICDHVAHSHYDTQ